MTDDAGPAAAAVVLAGGTARRFGGGDKTAAPLGAGTVLGALLAGLPAGLPVVVVGPEVDGGPAAGLAAGCDRLPAGADVVLALAGDHPFGGIAVPDLLAALAAAPAELDGVLGLDPGGRRQPLLAAYRRGPLRAALGAEPAGRSLREVLGGLRLAELPVTAAAALDVDTPDDLERARALLGGAPRDGS